MYNLDSLLTSEIKDKLHKKDLSLSLTLTAIDCEGRWPQCKVLIDNKSIFEGEIKNQQTITFNTEFNITDDNFILSIERYGKTNQDTIIDSIGTIISNQVLQIADLKLNDVDIIKNNLVYRGKFIMNLDANKRVYFNDNNIPTENYDYHFYENGIWSLQIGLPVLTYIINNTKQTETFEKIPYDDVIMAIIQKLEI
jgi:hypothetical protein